MPTAAPSTRTTTSPPPPSTSRGWLRRCAVTGAWRACTGCWTWRSGMTCRATAAGTGPKTWHRAPLCARAGAGQSGQGQREDAAQDGQLEPGVPPPGPSAPSPHLIAVHPDSAPCGLPEERRHARESGDDRQPRLDPHHPALRPPLRRGQLGRSRAHPDLSYAQGMSRAPVTAPRSHSTDPSVRGRQRAVVAGAGRLTRLGGRVGTGGGYWGFVRARSSASRLKALSWSAARSSIAASVVSGYALYTSVLRRWLR